MKHRLTLRIITIMTAACMLILPCALVGCDTAPADTDTAPASQNEATRPETPPDTDPAADPVTAAATEADTTPDLPPVAPNFTSDDVDAHKEIPLFADMAVPYYDEKVGLAPTIAAYIVADSPACVVILPGGGYFQRTDGAEGIEIAEAYNAAGISAFVVRYRYDANGMSGKVTYDRHAFMADAQRAVQFVRYYADSFGISRDKVAVCGFSAGGHLAMVISEHTDELYEGADQSAIGLVDSHPDALVLGYPLVNMKNAYYTVPVIFLNEDQKNQEMLQKYSYTYRLEALPPTFMFAYKSDDTVSVRINAQAMQKDMEAAGMTVECYLFKDGAHGIGLGKSYADYSRWHELSVAFLKNQFGL